MSLEDYVGRQYDVLAFPGAESSGEVLLNQQLFSDSDAGQVCVGTQKLAQRWLLEFMTVRGTMPLNMTTRGTDFFKSVYSGHLRTEFDVQTQFSFAAINVRDNLIGDETDDTPDDERIDKAILTDLILLPGFLRLGIEIHSQAGTSRAVILPIALTPTNLS